MLTRLCNPTRSQLAVPHHHRSEGKNASESLNRIATDHLSCNQVETGRLPVEEVKRRWREQQIANKATIFVSHKQSWKGWLFSIGG